MKEKCKNPDECDTPMWCRQKSACGRVNEVVYIAGPMRGYEYFNFPAFDKARDYLRSKGYLRIVSPADMDRSRGFDETDVPEGYDWVDLDVIGFELKPTVQRVVEAILGCDAIYMLRGWEESKGANAEKALAEWLGLNVYYEATEEAQQAENPDES
jgi:hypothetical protein